MLVVHYWSKGMKHSQLGGCLLQAWFREGSAAKELELFEDAAQAFFEAYRLDSSNAELAQAFQESIRLGQDQYKQQQAVQP